VTEETGTPLRGSYLGEDDIIRIVDEFGRN
jgi:hypothetical protein